MDDCLRVPKHLDERYIYIYIKTRKNIKSNIIIHVQTPDFFTVKTHQFYPTMDLPQALAPIVTPL